MTSPHLVRTAHRTGAAYLGIVACGIFAEFFVRGAVIVPGDASATAQNIAGAPAFFGLGIVADALMVALDVGVAYGLYRWFRGVDRRLAIAATVFRLVQASILAANLLSLVRALQLALDPHRALEALPALELHALVYDVGLIAFGLACITLSSLLHRAAAPRWLAAALLATGVVYLIGSGAALFAPSLLPVIDPLYAIAIIAEPAMAIWLLMRGRAGGTALSQRLV